VIARHLLGNAYPIKKLESVVEFLDHKRRPITESDRKPGPYRYYGANGPQGWIDDYIFDEPLILLAEDGGHFNSPDRGVAYRVSGKTWVNNHAHVLRPTEEVDIGFLCRVLENYDLTPFITGTTRGKLTKAGASEIPVIVPPLEEQRRIAAILDQAETLRTQRRTALALLDSLTQSLFLDMFGDLQTNSRNFEFSELGTVVKVIGGFAFKSEDFSEIGFPVIRISNLVNGSVDLSDAVKISPEKLKKGAAFQINPTDILMAMSGATTGKIATVGHIANSPIYQNQRVGNFRITNISKINTAYLLGILQSQFYQSHIWNLAGGAAQPNISSGQLESALIPLPPLPLQQTFATRIAAIEALKATHRRALAALDALFASLQQRAFAGAL